jgi:DNA polymerase III alpha subunit (gram-positive type)
MTLALCFDTETTGLIGNNSKKLVEQPEIIELSMQLVDLDTGDIEYKYNWMFKPTRPIKDPIITKITGITNEMLENKPFILEHLPNIAKTFQNCNIAVAHNASFDKQMLQFEFLRYQEKIVWPKIICTVEQTMHVKGYRLKLKEIYSYLFNENMTGTHRADADVDALVKVTLELYKRGWLI